MTLFCILLMVKVNGQEKVTEHREVTWMGYFNQTRSTDKTGVWTDVHLRLSDEFVNEVHALLGRVGYTYYFADRTRLTFGYAYQNQPGHGNPSGQMEHRSWQQIQWIERKPSFNLMQWIRLEQRFHKKPGADEFDFSNHRVRYNLALIVPLNKKEITDQTLFFFTNNEVFINFGKSVVNNYFDQNRFFVGFGFQFTQHVNAQIGYMNVFQQLPVGNRYVSSDAIRLFVFHSIDLRSNSGH